MSLNVFIDTNPRSDSGFCRSYCRRALARSVSAWLRSRRLALRVCVSASSWLRILLSCCSTSACFSSVDSCSSALDSTASNWPRHLGAVLDQLLVDPPALDRVEIDGDQRRNARAKRKEVVERARLDGRDGQTVAATDIESSAARTARTAGPAQAAPPRRRRSGFAVDALAHDDLIHRPAADGVGAVRLAQLHEAHCPPPVSDCPETDKRNARTSEALS